jgi:hypothetical protein
MVGEESLMRRLLLVAGISLLVLALPPDGAAAKECKSFDSFVGPLVASERVPCRSARRVLRRCDRSDLDVVGRTWNCRVLERTWRCRVTGEDDDGVFTACRSCRYRIRWEWCTTCNP